MMVSVGEFKYVAEGFLVPAISLFGLLGNLLTVIVLRDHREVGQSGGSTVRVDSLPQRKCKEIKQLPSMLPGPAVPGCC